MADVALIAAIAEHLPIGVWVARAPSGELEYSNQAFARIMGTEVRAFTREGHVCPEEKLPFARALAARSAVVVDDLVIGKPNSGVYVRAHASPLFDPSGVITHIIVAFTDISAEVRASLAQAEGEARLRHAQRMETLGQLAGGTAHDFNNVLASIKMLTSHLLLYEEAAAKTELLKQIDHVTDIGVRLTRGLLRMAQSEQGSIERMSLADLVTLTGELTRRTINRRIEIVTDVRTTHCDVLGDGAQLEQVLMNLVINARDAIPKEGRITLRVREATHDELSLGPEGFGEFGPVVLEVEDTGSGIPDGLRQRIFDPYFTTKISDGASGTGLGLAMVYGIIGAHGGIVDVAKTSRAGTAMRILLPRCNAGNVPRPPPSERRLGNVRVARATVLLVDDEPAVLSSTQRALTSVGYTVITATDGVEALRAVRAHEGRLSAVILDLVMPKMGGVDTLKTIRELYPWIPVIVTTGALEQSDCDEAVELGAKVIRKPYDLAKLSREIANVLD